MTCANEAVVQRAAASGRWTPDLRQHVTSCAACRDVFLVTRALSGAEPAAPPRRISPAILWAKARQARRRRAEAMASRILVGGQVATAVLGLSMLAYLGAEVGAWRVLALAFDALPIPAGGLLALLLTAGLAGLATRFLTRDSLR